MDTSERFDVFISYSSADVHLAEALHERLEAQGFSVWFDKKRLQPPCDWYRDILRDCERSRVVLPILTENWARSAWTKFETYSAPVVIPLVYEQDLAHWSQVAPPLTRHQGREIFVEGDGAWESLFKALREYLDSHQADVDVSNKEAIQVGYPHNRDFIGREEDLIAIAEGLFRARTPDLTQGRIFALSANGGYGKTTLARAYAEFYWRCYDEILWFNLALDEETADTPENARNETEHRIIAELGALHERFRPGVEEKDERSRAQRVLQLLSQSGRERRLLIIDDVAEAQGVERWLPTGGDIHVLITSRYSDWTYAESKPVYLLNPEHAVDLLIRRSKRPDTESEREEAKRLAEELDHLPLALEQAAAYIRASEGAVGFEGYIVELTEAPRLCLDKGVVLQSKHYPDCVARTWLITIQRLSSLAKEILELISALAPAPIPHFLFEEGLEVLLPEAQSPASARFEFREAMTELSRYSLITGNVAIPSHPPGDHAPGFSIHKLTQTVVWLNLEEKSREDRLQLLLQAMRSAIPKEDHEDLRSWPRWIPIAPHVTYLVREGDNLELNEEAALLMNSLGLFRFGEGLWTDAESLYRRALEIYEQNFGPDDLRVAPILINLSELLRHTKRYSEAEPLLRRALELSEQNCGPDHPHVARSLHCLAILLYDTHRYAEAESLYRRALEIDKQSFGSNHPNVAAALNNLAELLVDTNRRSEAEPLYRSALEIHERSYGPDHPNVATSLDNLARFLCKTNRRSEAEPLFRRSLVIREKSYGLDNPLVARSLNNLATFLWDTNRHDEAEPLYRNALDIFEKRYGPDHLEVATSLFNLVGLLCDPHRHLEAEPFFRLALEICEQKYGPGHPHVATILNNLATFLCDANRLAEAEPLYWHALKIREQCYGPDHPHVAELLNNFAVLLWAMGRHGEAESVFRRALDVFEHSFGPYHPEVATCLNNLARLLYDTNRLGDAEPLYRHALEIREQCYGPESPDVATALNNLASLLCETNRCVDAEPLYRRALNIDERIYGPEHPRVATTLNNFAVFQAEMGRSREAVVTSRKAAKILLRASAAAGHDLQGLRESISVYNKILKHNSTGARGRRSRLEKLYKECGWRPQGDIDAE